MHTTQYKKCSFPDSRRYIHNAILKHRQYPTALEPKPKLTQETIL
jgi:hypothetical protein